MLYQAGESMSKKASVNPLEFITGFVVILITMMIILFVLYNIAPSFVKETLGLKKFLEPMGIGLGEKEVPIIVSSLPDNARLSYKTIVLASAAAVKTTDRDCLLRFDKIPVLEDGYSIRITSIGSKYVVTALNKASNPVDSNLQREEIEGKDELTCIANPITFSSTKSIHTYPYLTITGKGLLGTPNGKPRGKINNVDTESEYTQPFLYIGSSGKACFMMLEQALVGNDRRLPLLSDHEYLFSDDLKDYDFFNTESKYKTKICGS